MNATSILEKFESVEIENASRISDEELAFCTEQQTLYEKTLDHYRIVSAALENLQNGGTQFMQSVEDVNCYVSNGYTYNHYSNYEIDYDKKECAKKKFGSIHENFISLIIIFFNDKYGTALEAPSHEVFLGIKEPKFESTFDGFRGMNEEEKAERRAQNLAYQIAYDEALEEYLYYLMQVNLDYNAILDHIFVSLDGNTFAERAEQEIKNDSREASTYGSGKLKYEIKNKKISLDILHPNNNYGDEYKVELRGKGYMAVLRALSYYDSLKRVIDTYPSWKRFICYSMRESEGIFNTHEVGGNKVLTFRFYKNGKFDIGFDSHLSAKRFAKEYLYCAAGGDEE